MDISLEENSAVPLQPMPHQSEVQKSEDDWAGVTSTHRRRKLQNRLNQRAYRKRKLLGACSRPTVSLDTNVPALAELADNSHEQPAKAGRNLGSPARQTCRPYSAERLAMLQRFAEQAYAEYIASVPCPAHLPRLVQLNVLNALACNATALGLSADWLLCDAISPFGQLKSSPASCPSGLRPTALQVSMPHHPWIDLLPLPRMRDNVLYATATESFDEDNLCYDLAEFDSNERSDMASLIIWGEPWDPRGWEVSVAFLRKWGWLLVGCSEILEATNYWREKRGERRLIFEL